MVARRVASAMGNSVLPGFQPSATARSQSRLNSGAWPTITLKPLSRRLRRLGRSLHSVADDRDDLLLEDLAGPGHREFLPRDDVLHRSTEIDQRHAAPSVRRGCRPRRFSWCRVRSRGSRRLTSPISAHSRPDEAVSEVLGCRRARSCDSVTLPQLDRERAICGGNFLWPAAVGVRRAAPCLRPHG